MVMNFLFQHVECHNSKGSFVTKKINPKDVDFILVADSGVYDEGSNEQREVLDGLTDGELWKGGAG